MFSGQYLAVLYDLEMTLSSEMRLQPLLTKVLQRLLFHSGFPIGMACLSDPNVSRAQGGTFILEAAIGDHVLAKRQGQVITLEASQLPAEACLMMGASWLDLPDTSLTADSTVLYLPMPSTGFLLLWAPTHKEVHLPVQQLFKPVMANLEKSIRLCRHNEDYTHAIEQDRDEAREQLAEQLARTDLALSQLRTLYDALPDLVWLKDPHGIYLDCNLRFTQFFGASKADIVGKRDHDFVSTELANAFLEHDRKAMQQDRPTSNEEWLTFACDGYHGLFETIKTPIRDRSGQLMGVMGVARDITLLRQHQQQLDYAAHYNALTGLPNQVLLIDRIHQSLKHGKRKQSQVALCYLDLDGFKDINDRLGREVGDQLLVSLSRQLRQSLREEDTLAHLGGDDFVILLVNRDETANLPYTLQQLLDSLHQPVQIGHHTINMSASIGATSYPSDQADPDTLLRHAHHAMYVAKKHNKGTACLYDPELDRRERVHQDGLSRIRQGLKQDEFRLYYQPKIDMRSGKLVGVEALIRWQHPERGVLAPAYFLPDIMNTPMEIVLGDWVLAQAFAQATRWNEQGNPIQISINISASQLQEDRFYDKLTQLLQTYPLVSPHQIELEVLESSALQDIDKAVMVLERCRALGMGAALDDFGTGYSSLTFFRRLPVNLVKIDRSFVSELPSDLEDQVIIEGVVSMARLYQRQIIAEGVESIEHGKTLLQLGCHWGQGYAIGHPMPAEQLAIWQAEWRRPEQWAQEHHDNNKYCTLAAPSLPL